MRSRVEITPAPSSTSERRARVQIVQGATGVLRRSVVQIQHRGSPAEEDPLRTRVEILPSGAVSDPTGSDPLSVEDAQGVSSLAQLEEARARALQTKEDVEQRLIMLDAAIEDHRERLAGGPLREDEQDVSTEANPGATERDGESGIEEAAT